LSHAITSRSTQPDTDERGNGQKTLEIGLVVLVPYSIAAHHSGETTPWWNVFVHAVGTAGVLILLTVPARQLGQRACDGRK